MASAGTDPIINLGFETAGAFVGGAKNWSLSSGASWLHAGFITEDQPAGIVVAPSIDSWNWSDALVNAGVIAAPNGSNDGDSLEDVAINGLHQVDSPIDVLAGERYVLSAWLRAGDLAHGGFRVGSGGDFVEVLFDLRTGNVTAYTENCAGISASSYRVVAGRGAWKLYAIAFEADTDATLTVSINTSPNGVQFGYIGAGEFIYVWQPRVILGSCTSVESWDSWVNGYAFSLGVSNSIEAFFDTETAVDDPYESFEKVWSATHYTEFVWNAFVAMFDVASNAFDAMSWATFVTTFSGVTALFNAGLNAQEDYESGWETFVYAWGDVVESVAQFDDSSDNFEDFEQFQADVTMTSSASANTLNATLHGLTDGTLVWVVGYPGSAMPGGLSHVIQYEVINAAPNTLQLATDGVTPIDITTDSTCIVRGDPLTQWTGAEVF